MQIDVALGVDIFLHILVNIQMVRGNVGHNRHIRRFSHRDELEAGQLDHSAVVRSDLLNARQ